MKNILFVCSRNRLRSPTAETVFSGIEGFDVRSAGLYNDATVLLTPDLVQWADYIFVMEKAHREKLRKKFRRFLKDQRVICLDIPDEFEYMEEGLVELLKQRMGNFFKTRSQ